MRQCNVGRQLAWKKGKNSGSRETCNRNPARFVLEDVSTMENLKKY